MKTYSIATRYIAMILLLAMVLGMVPALELGAQAWTYDPNTTYTDGDSPFKTKEQDGVNFLKNGESITLPIRINNFETDGMMFEYLSSVWNIDGAEYYRWEYTDDGKAYVQLYSYYAEQYVTGGGVSSAGTRDLYADTGGWNGVTDSTINMSYSTNLYQYDEDSTGWKDDGCGYRSDNAKTYSNLRTSYGSDGGGTYYMRLTPSGTRGTSTWGNYNSNYNNPDGTGKGRAWRRLTWFNDAVPVENIRYVTIVYRIPESSATPEYTNMGLTAHYFNGDSGDKIANCSEFVTIHSTPANQWQFVVIDLLGGSGDRYLKAGESIQQIYLQAPLLYSETNTYMDIAAVGYYSHYGDAEEFGYYGVSMGGIDRFYWSDNRGFDFRSAVRQMTSTSDKTISGGRTDELYNWATSSTDRAKYTYYYRDDNYFPSVRDWTYQTYGSYEQFTFSKVTGDTNSTVIYDDAAKAIDELGYALFGEYDGWGTMGLVESALDENGRPVYKESVVSFVAALMHDRLTVQQEYPGINYYWRNYSFLTGTSVRDNADGSYTVLYGEDDYGKPMDLGTAICKQIGATKGAGGSGSGTIGTYAETAAHAGELIGTWNNVKGNIKTWTDAAYFMLHNLYVTDADKAFDKKDGYGVYEDTYQYLTMPQAEVTVTHSEKQSDGTYEKVDTTDTVYFFDSGYGFDNSTNNNKPTGKPAYESGLIYDTATKTITLDANSEGKPIIYGSTWSNYFPFLPTSGNGTEWGETNQFHYLHGIVWDNSQSNKLDKADITHSAMSRKDYGLTYQKRDFHYTLTGNGFFSYEKDLFFQFEGDDDVYLYINGELVLDIGGTHGATTCIITMDDYVEWAWAVKNGEITYNGVYYNKLANKDRARVDALALVEGQICSFDFFYMERHAFGSNLRIATNIEITAEGLEVDKFAYQKGVEVNDNGMVNVDEMIEYGFSITNTSDYKLYSLRFNDPIIGLSLDYEKGMTVINPDLVTDANGGPLDISDLIITVDGFFDEEKTRPTDTITVQLNDQTALKNFLANLVAPGLGSGDPNEDRDKLFEGSGLWKHATIRIRGIYYTMTDAQKVVSSFRNYVVAEGDAGETILRGSANHTVYQPGNPAYFQWAGKAIVISNEQIYNDLINGGVVASAADLPDLGHMRLVPSNSAGTAVDTTYVDNVVSGDVYLKICYPNAGTNMAYVTILDVTDDSFRMTVPLTVYVMDVKNTMFVLDYGLDSYLTDSGAIFDYEMGIAAGGNVTGTVMGLAASGTPSYMLYQEEVIQTSKDGNTPNHLDMIAGSYSNGTFTNARYKLESSIVLNHDKPWVIEFQAGNLNGGVLLLSESTHSGESGNRYLYLRKNGDNSMVTFGHWDTYYYNSGIKTNTLVDGSMHTYRIYNDPKGNGQNEIYISIDGGDPIAMKTNWSDKASSTYTDVDYTHSGIDFTFNYMGTDTHKLNLDMKYLKVYPDGVAHDNEQFAHYRWVTDTSNSKGLVTNNTGNTGYVTNNTLSLINGTVTSGVFTDEARWEMSKNVVLDHDRAWEVEFKTSTTSSVMVMSSQFTAATTHSEYIFLAPNADSQLVTMGYRDTNNSRYVNYAIAVDDVYPSFSMAEENSYLLKNVIYPNGSNMVHLYIKQPGETEFKYVGALNTMCYNTDLTNNVKSNGLSGMNFTFHFIGGDKTSFGFTDGATLAYLDVRMDTALRVTHEWVATEKSFASTVVTADGNRISFEKDADGVVTLNGDGNADANGDYTFTLSNDRLKFSATDFLENRYTAYIAITVHEKGFAPTPLGQTGVDVGSEVQMYKQVTVLPANVVYYEDDFPAVHYAGTQVDSFTTLTDDTEYIVTGSSAGLTQDPSQDTPYGSDDTYADTSLNTSGNSLHTIAINNDGALAWFEFTGRGFELDARTNAVDSGMMLVRVYEKGSTTQCDSTGFDIGNGKLVKMLPVITDFDQGNTVNGSFNSNNGGAETIYQVPVIRYYSESTASKEYVVVIYGVESHDYSSGTAEHVDTYLYLDGIRIYRPLANTGDGYNADIPEYGNQNMANFERLRELIVGGKVLVCNGATGNSVFGTGTMTWTEKYDNKDWEKNYGYQGNAVNSVNDYLLDGPNNEVYVDGTFTSGAIAFYVRALTTGDYKSYEKDLQIAVRALDAGLYYGAATTGMKANLSLGVLDSEGKLAWTHLATVTSGTEQYYDIPFRLCPTESIVEGTTTRTYYRVVIRVESADPSIPAMVSFSGIKRTSGLVLSEALLDPATITQQHWYVTSGTGYTLLNNLNSQLITENMVLSNELPAVGEFEASDNAAIKPQRPTLSFEDEVFYNIYYTVDSMDEVGTDDMGLITFGSALENGTIKDALDVIPGAIFADGEYVVRTNGISAKDLGDTLYFKVYAKQADGSYIYSDLYSYSALTYANNCLANSTDDALKGAVVAMLNYGAAAQEYFGYRTDSLMNAGLTAEQQALAAKYDSSMVSKLAPVDAAKAGAFSQNVAGFSKKYPTISLEGAFAINYYFIPENSVDGNVTFYYWTQDAFNGAEVLTADNASGVYVMNADADGRYGAEVSGIAAKDLDKAVYVAAVYESNGITYSTGVLPYSLGAFCASHADNAASSMQQLAASAAVYGYYAKNFFAD